MFRFTLSISLLGNEVPIINIVARNSRLPTDEGYLKLIKLKCVIHSVYIVGKVLKA